jgi:hypothetical protein
MHTESDRQAVLRFLPPDWMTKRESLVVHLFDLPHLVEEFKNRKIWPYTLNPQIMQFDPAPGLRLVNACEGMTNTLYGLAEITAHFAGNVSRGIFPSSFAEESTDATVRASDSCGVG